MTLSSSISAAVTGMKTYQEALSIHSQNITNANTEGYIKQTVSQSPIVTNGVGQGVSINSITSEVDQRLTSNLRSQSSVLGRSGTLTSYLTQAESLYGTPEAGNSMSSVLDNFFSAFSSLATNPSEPSLRSNALTAATQLADNISTTANNLEDLRFQADSDIKSNVDTVNSLLSDLDNINQQIPNFSEGSGGLAELKRQRDLKLQDLAKYLDVTVQLNDHNQAFISTGGGVALLDYNKYQLSYSPTTSKDSFINDSSLGAISVSAINRDTGEAIGTSVDLVSSGTSDQVTTSLTQGSIKGLLEIRDTIVPNFLNSLDELASNLSDAVNAIHNDGSSFPPATSLTGTRAISASQEVGFDGSVLISVVNQNGDPASSPYPNETYFRPLTLDLSSLDSGDGAGQPTVQTIMDEINNYYGPPQSLATVGNLRNIQIASKSDTIATGSTFNIDFDLDNIAATGSTVEITNLSVNNGGALGSALPAAYSLNAGAKERTNDPVTIDLTAGSGGPYTITATVKVTDADGNVSSADVTYTVDDTASGALNDRFSATSVTNVSGTSSFTASPSSQRFLTAKLVDANGNTITDGSAGYLVLQTNGTTNGVAISELDSQEVGTTTTSASDVTNQGFSHYFGLNNFFVDNYQTTNSAVNMAVRSDIASDANKISTGTLTASPQPADTTQALYTYELGLSGNEIAQRIGILGQMDVSFAAAGNLPSSTQTLGNYVGHMVSDVSTRSSQASNTDDINQLTQSGYEQMFQKSAGVNIDEELSQIVTVENNYKAVAHLVNTVSDLFNALIQAV